MWVLNALVMMQIQIKIFVEFYADTAFLIDILLNCLYYCYFMSHPHGNPTRRKTSEETANTDTSSNGTFAAEISSVISRKGELQNKCYKKTKLVKFFEKRTFLFPEMFDFWKIWRALFSCNTCFEVCPFALLSTISKPLTI